MLRVNSKCLGVRQKVLLGSRGEMPEIVTVLYMARFEAFPPHQFAVIRMATIAKFDCFTQQAVLQRSNSSPAAALKGPAG